MDTTKQSKSKTECSICGESFINVKSHQTKIHKRNMWKFVLHNSDDPDKTTCDAYYFGGLVEEKVVVTGSGLSDDFGSILQFYFYPNDDLRRDYPHMSEFALVWFPKGTKESYAMIRNGPRSAPKAIQKENVTIEYA